MFCHDCQTFAFIQHVLGPGCPGRPDTIYCTSYETFLKTCLDPGCPWRLPDINIIWDILKTCFVCRLLAKTRHYTLYIVRDSCIQVAREDCQTLYLYIIHNTLYIAMHFENIFCIQVAREDCQTVPVQKCDSVKDEQCRNVPRKVGRKILNVWKMGKKGKQYRNVPRQVGGKSCIKSG